LPYSPEKYLLNKEKHSAYDKAYREKYSEKNKARLKKYKEQNREKFAAYERKRRALKRGLPAANYTTEDLLSTYGTSCHICGTEIDLDASRRTGYPGWERGLQIDHLISISNSGSDTIDNVRPSHGLCNLRKNKYSLKIGKG
jgi:5-methylcytosine-specific restriction endonuclease McrA